ncbi:hypothetical protein E5676_scaffold127G00670 [Cucumis melo var. makuwa]|uniref:Uncharacterized protein n=2 Tax=Cucumis melo TaxID=3656 RepID=A0A5D3CEX3_CUCMM|nr:hypothetical protein E5676_scaffold127G00670 [Cucumis melo var. makuwa]
MDAWTKCGDLKRNERLERTDDYWWVVVGVERLTTTFDGEERRLGLGQRLEKKKKMMIERVARDTTSDGTNLGDTTSDGNQIDETVDVTIDARISIAMEKWFHYLQTMPKKCKAVDFAIVRTTKTPSCTTTTRAKYTGLSSLTSDDHLICTTLFFMRSLYCSPRLDSCTAI